MNAWIGDICQHIKSVAPNALVGIGYEGFYGSGAGGLLLLFLPGAPAGHADNHESTRVDSWVTP